MKMITLPGRNESSNVYILVGRPITLIDTGCDERIIPRMMKLGLRPEMVGRIINTHCHYDHIFCNELFTEAEVMIHEKDARAVEEMNAEVTLAAERRSEVLPKVDKRLSEGDEIRIGKEVITVIHTPGHTAGSICLLTENGELFTGDTLFRDGIGRTDFPTGNKKDMVRSLKKLISINFNEIYPGHGLIASKQDVEKYFGMSPPERDVV